MPALRNALTGRRRRRGSRNLSRKRRAQRLDVNQRDFLVTTVHPSIKYWGERAYSEQTVLFMLVFFYQSISCCRDDGIDKALLPIIDTQIQKIFVDLSGSLMLMKYWLNIDQAIGDIPEAEENEEVYHHVPKYRSIDDFADNNEAIIETGFSKAELWKLMTLFGLPKEIYCVRPDGKFDRFNREELLIFTLIKFRKGFMNATVVDHYVGGKSESHWGRGYKWMVQYLDKRYAPIIGPEGLERWVGLFPYFSEKFREKLAKETKHIDPDTYEVIDITPGVHFEPGTFAVVGLVDCKDYPMLRPHSGPGGDFPGAMRRPGWYERQRAFYTGRKKKHALKVISFCLPNGMTAAVYGPVSARHHDHTVLTWSGIDPFLSFVQQNAARVYAFYGDCAFLGGFQNIRTRHRPTPLFPLTQRQEHENVAMKKAREAIEWSYGLLTNLWHLSENREAFKLETDPNAVMAQIRVMHLLTNCYTCMHGNQVSSRHTFACPPPTLEAYLAL
jgi:hypothetical protein